MARRTHNRIIVVVFLLLLQLHLHRASESAIQCSGQLWCSPQNHANTSTETSYFRYSPESQRCHRARVAANCFPTANCSFLSLGECQVVCEDQGTPALGGCEGTKYGCCEDGITVNEGDNCAEDVESVEEGDHESRSTNWGLFVSGLCGAALLLGLVAVVGLSMYTYRQRHKNRHRWYIHEVLQMYDGNASESDISSDSSWDDPEHKNLFDRL